MQVLGIVVLCALLIGQSGGVLARLAEGAAPAGALWVLPVTAVVALLTGLTVYLFPPEVSVSSGGAVSLKRLGWTTNVSVQEIEELSTVFVPPPWYPADWWVRRTWGVWWHPGVLVLVRLRHTRGCLLMLAVYDEFEAFAYCVKGLNPSVALRLPGG
jgi:hypothetical protein